MIKNEKQYQITIKHLKDFKEVLAGYEKNMDASDLLLKMKINGVRSRIIKFEDEIAEYENLQNGKLATVNLNSLDDIPELLIKARLAKRWTHATLAEKVGLKEQQIQKYEATDYAGASALRLQLVIDALRISIPTIMVQIGVPEFDTDDIPADVLQEEQNKLSGTMLLCA